MTESPDFVAGITPIEHPSLVYEWLVDQLLKRHPHGEVHPGGRFSTERDLAQRLEVCD